MACETSDTWAAKITELLVKTFDGRAKFSKLRTHMYQRKLMKGYGMKNVLKKLKSGRFLVFEKDGRVKYISVFCKDTNMCSKFRRKHTACAKEGCLKYHVCKFFVTGSCTYNSKCLFGHDLQSEANVTVSNHLGLSSFSPEDIRTIILRSHPAVCMKYNTGGCDDDGCPDLHVCSRFIIQECKSGASCKLGHSFRSSEHNQWVLNTFHLSHLMDGELKKQILVKNLTPTAGTGSQSELTPAASSSSLLGDPMPTSEEETQEYVIKVFRFLLNRFGGRTKFGIFLTERGHLLQLFNHTAIIEWLKHNNDWFVLYESGNDVKFISVFNKRAKVCSEFSDPNSSGCDNLSCKYFHICNDLVTGTCINKGCRLSHSFSSWPNAKVRSDLNLDQFTDSEICTLIICSSPVVCVNHNTSSCQNKDCLDLHICSKNILNQCTSGHDCKFGHVIRDSGEHNLYVLKAFRMDTLQESELRRLVIVKKRNFPQTVERATTLLVKTTPSGDHKGHATVLPLQLAPSGGQTKLATVSPEQTASTQSQTGVPTTTPVNTALIDNQTRVLTTSPVQRTSTGRQIGALSVSRVQAASTGSQIGVSTVSRVQAASTGSQIGVSTVSRVQAASTGSQIGVSTVSRVQAASIRSQIGASIVSRVQAASTGSQTGVSTAIPLHVSSVKELAVRNTADTRDSRAAKPDIADAQRENTDNTPVLLSMNSDQDNDARKYEYICETYTWTGVCLNSPDCPRYHNPDRMPYLWQIRMDTDEKCYTFPIETNPSLESTFCDLSDAPFSIDFDVMSFTKRRRNFSLRRLSTPSYVTATPGTPLNFYTQWVWYRRERDGTYTPFYPGTLQYTLEEKYLSGQHKYYLEFDDLRLMVDTHSSPMIQINLDTRRTTKILRRPVFVSIKKSKFPTMSPLLLSKTPKPMHKVPAHWTTVDHFQDFELIELDSADAEYDAVQRQFFSTMDVREHDIVHVFRVQNPGLWDKYCSVRRAMTPKGQATEDVEERQLFHGTPTLKAARGICANSFDFRRSGENVGAVHGKGAYFSTTARYSHSYTRAHTPVTGDPLRFMFLGRILVGQYTLGHPSYTKPPERDRLKLYDSCVNDCFNPTIFVIFDLAQSYPEYLIEYETVLDDVEGVFGRQLLLPSSVTPPSAASSSATTHKYSLRSNYNNTSAQPASPLSSVGTSRPLTYVPAQTSSSSSNGVTTVPSPVCVIPSALSSSATSGPTLSARAPSLDTLTPVPSPTAPSIQALRSSPSAVNVHARDVFSTSDTWPSSVSNASFTTSQSPNPSHISSPDPPPKSYCIIS